MRVLIVDDDGVELAALEHTLRQAGYDVQCASNGLEALVAIRHGCRLVITDQCMPEMDGFELCRTIRTEQFPSYVYIILLTAHGSVDDRVQGLSAGADDFLSKPYDRRELLARLRAGERVLALESREVTIFALAKLAESRDPDTGAHLERVRCYSHVLAKDLALRAPFRDQITPEFIRLIYLTSPLHDIGKVGIPDSVLLKRGPLTPREFEIMKQHTRIGAATIDAALRLHPTAAYLRMARDIAAHHHERYDGTGYPDGLAGEAIPLSARIVALADVYDALRSRRVYKGAMTHDAARAILIEGAGTQHDPAIVEAFLRCEQDFLEILDRFQEPTALAA